LNKSIAPSSSEVTGDIDSPELLAHVAAIRSLGKQTIANVIEIGKHLTECKRIVGRGGWVPWLKREFAWFRQTADRFIQVFEASGKLPKLGKLNLPVSAIYLLAEKGTPEKVLKDIVDRASKGEKVKHDDVKAAVETAKPTKKMKSNGAAAPANADEVWQEITCPGCNGTGECLCPGCKGTGEAPEAAVAEDDTTDSVADPVNEIQRLRKQVIGLESEIKELQSEAEKLRKENADLKASLKAWKSATGVEQNDAMPDPGHADRWTER
jgi:hypothetical protein